MSKSQKTKISLKKWENEGGSLASVVQSQSSGISRSYKEKHDFDSRAIAKLGDATGHQLRFSQAMLARLLKSKGEYS